MSNEEITTATNNSTKQFGSWDWIWLSIVGIIIVKLFGLVGGLLTIGVFFWLKPKIGTWGAVAISGVFGVVAVLGLSAMLVNVASTSPEGLPISSTQEQTPKLTFDLKGWNQESAESAEVGSWSWLTYTSAGIQLSNALAKDIGQAYGFCLGQDYSLSKISKKYPHMSGLALVAEKEFSATFKSSIEGMDVLMSKHAKTEWDKIKGQLTNQIADSINIEQITESQALQFIELVRQRAKGNIESPVIETLLLFKSGYEKHPEREFLDGYKYKYITNGTGKAKGVAFSIEAPKTWAAKEGNRPNIVQKFVSENGRGLELLLVFIKEMPLPPGEIITAKDVAEILNPIDIKDFLPGGAEYITSGKLTVENLPGFWVHFKMNGSRVRNSIGIETIMYTIFYKNKMIQIQGQVTTSVNGKPIERGGLKQYGKLFDLMVNSFVVASMYK